MSVPADRLDVDVFAEPPVSGLSDRVAVEQALVRKYPELTRLLIRKIGDRQLALDMLHEAVVTTLSKMQGEESLPAEVIAGQIFRVAINHSRNHWRHSRNMAADSEHEFKSITDAAVSAWEDSQRASNRQLVRRFLQSLEHKRDREVLVRFYLNEEDKAQVCSALSLSELQFKSVVSRARERMRQLMQQSGYESVDVLGIALLLAASVLLVWR